MRLIHARTNELQEFNEPQTEYAILSHRWVDGHEVRLQDWEVYVARQESASSQIQCKSGFAKIRDACTQAHIRGLEWLWADTVCIDKTNDVEVRTSINRMFSWYQSASICFVYLDDVQNGKRLEDMTEDKPKWFTRGWTLQELLAPKIVLFFDQTWNFLGNRKELADVISKFTRIPVAVLRDGNIQSYSHAERISWSIGRKTTLPEDLVYSLLGLSEVTLFAEYGIGYQQALLRLKSAILERKREGHFPATDNEYLWKVIKDLENHDTGKLGGNEF
jgi:hypothetical protein